MIRRIKFIGTMEHLMKSVWGRAGWGLIGLGAVVVFGVAWWLIQGGNVRLVAAGAVLAVLGSLAFIRPRVAIVATLVFLAVLGEFRRVLIPLAGWSSHDPLLLVGPAIAVLLVGFIVAGRQLSLDTLLSRGILMLMLVMLIQMVNPKQGGLMVGLAGGLFYVVPLLWFWIGRSYATPDFVRFLLYRVVVPLAVLAALLGLYQTYFGLLSFERDWVDLGGYNALKVGIFTRPISFFTSASEYAFYLGIALIVLWAGLMYTPRFGEAASVGTPMVDPVRDRTGRERGSEGWFGRFAYPIWGRFRSFNRRGGWTGWLGRALLGLVLIALLASALFFVSSRGPVVMTLFAVVVLWVVRARRPAYWLPRLILGLALGIAVVVWSLSSVQQSESGRVEALITHQVMGLLEPFNPQLTAASHASLFLNGLAEGTFYNPLGRGLGATTIATTKFSDADSTDGADTGGTEVDLSNMFVSLGIVGGVIYMVIIILVLLIALRYWHKSRTLVGLAILGILVFGLGQWLNGGQYAVSALIWFAIGALDRFQRLTTQGQHN